MVSSDATDSQKQVLKLMDEKKRLESEIEQQGLVLKSNNIGFHEPLVDDDGFPRNDIDARSVRLARNQIICLQNDLKLVMKCIEEGLTTYFLERKDLPQTSSSSSTAEPSQTKDDLKPFLIVNLVDENSPGYTAGIIVRDLILSFGSINYKNFKNLAQIGELVKNSENHPVRLKIRRNCSDLEVTIIPKVWQGQGLLGFKVAAL